MKMYVLERGGGWMFPFYDLTWPQRLWWRLKGYKVIDWDEYQRLVLRGKNE